EMAQMLHENIVQNGVDLRLNNSVESFEDRGNRVAVKLGDSGEIEADMVILSIGVRPNSQIAKEAGLEINQRGGIVVDEYLKTSDENIYAVGDVIEVNDFVMGGKTMIALAGPANKQGRIVANNIAGKKEVYEATMGTSVAQVFDLSVASTGTNEKMLIREGLKENVDYRKIYVTQNSHAGYYPGAVPLTIKLIFSMDGTKIYGAQIVGMDSVDKRIDTIATTMRLGGNVFDLKKLELAYAPPFSSAKDPVNMAGFTAQNVMDGMVEFSGWDVKNNHKDALLLDVREEAELMAFEIPNAVNIPLGQLRNRLGELDKNKEIITFCAIGVRSYNAARILMQNGFTNVKLYPGGTRFYQSTHYEDFGQSQSITVSDSGHVASTEKQFEVVNHSSNEPAKTIQLNCMGMQCPGPLMQVFETMNEVNEGDILEVSASDPGFTRDIKAWSQRTGNTLISAGKDGNKYVAVLKKTTKPEAVDTVSPNQETIIKDTPQGKTMIVFSGDFDKVLASFIIANGAAAMGRPVTMFFTFWGLSALRKENPPKVKKGIMEKMFGFMLPKGSKKLGLSKMNMGGMGKMMMKKIMKDKNVNSLEELIQSAMKNGVKIMACTMSMDVLGITEEELIDGIEYVGVGTYLGDAEESNVNLFI
ncbi:MAG: FAD-dependent oxidoreductase, partial [Tissierellia bacterium]|nr:FAD-dependent oxidoreductase [Tissierellia bacterium]